MSETEREWLTTTEVAAKLGRTAQTVRNLARQRKLRGYFVGGHWQFTPEDVEAFIQAACNTPEARAS